MNNKRPSARILHKKNSTGAAKKAAKAGQQPAAQTPVVVAKKSSLPPVIAGHGKSRRHLLAHTVRKPKSTDSIHKPL